MGSSGESRWMPNPPWAGDSGREVGNTVRASPEGWGLQKLSFGRVLHYPSSGCTSHSAVLQCLLGSWWPFSMWGSHLSPFFCQC